MTQQSWEEMLQAQRDAQRAKQERLSELLENGNLKEWADRLTAEGKELRMHWDGGGDSGWVDFLIDDESPTEGEDADNAEILRDLCYEMLDYGSWAGEFSASGDCIYNPESGSFEGTDHYSEDDQQNYDYPINITVPDNIWFDQLDFTVQDEEISVQVDFIVKNGFMFPGKEEIERKLAEEIEDQFEKAVEKFIEENNSEYRSMWEEISIPFSDFKDMGNGTRMATITNFDIGIFNSEEKDITISLTTEQEHGV